MPGACQACCSAPRMHRPGNDFFTPESGKEAWAVDRWASPRPLFKVRLCALVGVREAAPPSCPCGSPRCDGGKRRRNMFADSAADGPQRLPNDRARWWKERSRTSSVQSLHRSRLWVHPGPFISRSFRLPLWEEPDSPLDFASLPSSISSALVAAFRSSISGIATSTRQDRWLRDVCACSHARTQWWSGQWGRCVDATRSAAKDSGVHPSSRYLL
jgi:hypothetical protein